MRWLLARSLLTAMTWELALAVGVHTLQSGALAAFHCGALLAVIVTATVLLARTRRSA
jgi:hypothetical protein